MNTTYRYQDSNGRIACYNHIGCSAQAEIDNDANINEFDTDLTSWFRMTNDEVAEFATFINSNEICEDCRHQ